MAPAPSTSAGATTFPMGIATATETSWTPVESVEAPVTSMSAAVRRSRMETATVTATSSTPLAIAEALARRMPMPMAFATTWTSVSANTMPVASAMAPGPSTTAGVPTFLTATATAMEIRWTPSACAEAIARPMWTGMASATSMKGPVAPMRRPATSIPLLSRWTTSRSPITAC